MHARLRDGKGPEEILDRGGAALATCLRAVASLRPGDTLEVQEWGNCRLFPGQAIVESREGALLTADSWSQGDTIWTDGSRLDSGKIGAACVWRILGPCGWAGCRYHLGNNKEVFDAEVYAIIQALNIIDQRQECGHRYTVSWIPLRP